MLKTPLLQPPVHLQLYDYVHNRFSQLSYSVQATNKAFELASSIIDPQDTVSNWHAVKALPSTLDFAEQQLGQQAAQLQTARQSLKLSMADAKAELTAFLDQLQGAHSDNIVAQAVQSCLQTASEELAVRCCTFVLNMHVQVLKGHLVF